MSTTITLHIFSGRPDPSWVLSAEQVKEFTTRLKTFTTPTIQKPHGLMGGLGYRGFSVISVGEQALEPYIYIYGGIIDKDRFGLNRITHTPDLEEWLLSTAGDVVPDEVKQEAKKSISNNLNDPIISPVSAPLYDPEKWNANHFTRDNNNCYNYANDIVTNTFAQPGRGSNFIIFGRPECSNIGAAADHDGEISVPAPDTIPTEGHFIALVIWPGHDFHWYRLDSNGMWSHKPGSSAAINTDSSGELISDPISCNRGPYKDFCGFYHCIPSKITII